MNTWIKAIIPRDTKTSRIMTGTAAVLLVILCFLALFWSDGQQKLIRNGDIFPVGEEETVLLADLERGKNGRYGITLQPDRTDMDKEWMLCFIECEPFVLYVDGTEWFRYGESNGYQRIINVSLGELFADGQEKQLEIETEDLDYSNYVYLGTAEKISYLFTLTIVLQAFEVGVLLAMLIYAVSLYRWKSSEGYLPPFFIYLGILLVWTICQLEFYPMVFNMQFFKYLQSLFATLTILECIQAGFLFAGCMPDGLKDILNWYDNLTISMVFAVLSLILAGTAAERVIAAIPYVLGSIAAVYLCIRSEEKYRPLVLMFVFCHVVRTIIFASVTFDCGRNIYFNSLRAVPGFELFFAVICMLMINRLFAGKFQQTDELVEKLEEANRRLDEKVEERTRQLKENEQKKRQLMMNVFHDLRSPIFVVRGYLDMLPAATPDAEKTRKVMKEKLAFLHRLTEDLFLLSKLEDNKVLFCEDAVDLAELLDGIIEAARVEAEAKEITVEADLQEECRMVGDSFRLEQAFQNLLTNAVRYTPDGGRIQVRLAHESEAVLKVEVEDNGIGIPEDEVDKIFQLYYVRDRSSKSNSTGLGLSITQEIIRHHAGTIEVKSHEKEGTIFTVRLPVDGGVDGSAL